MFILFSVNDNILFYAKYDNLLFHANILTLCELYNIDMWNFELFQVVFLQMMIKKFSLG